MAQTEGFMKRWCKQISRVKKHPVLVLQFSLMNMFALKKIGMVGKTKKYLNE